MRTILLMISVLFAIGCAKDYTGKPVEYARLCDKENNKQMVEVTGFFKHDGSAMCSKSGSDPMRCPVKFVDNPDNPNPPSANIDLGSGKSAIENVEGKGLVIHDEKVQVVAAADKVKVTAEVFVSSAPPSPDIKTAPCVLTVKKIEKIN
ncbi:MAG: hypothetical protein IPN69_03920 [Acidobacteria bacterium]|nr:hypothetical protein [Acidobacteriota bacterium]